MSPSTSLLFPLLSAAPLPHQRILSFWMLLTLCQLLSDLCSSFSLQDLVTPSPHSHVRLRLPRHRLTTPWLVRQRSLRSQSGSRPPRRRRTRPHSHMRLRLPRQRAALHQGLRCCPPARLQLPRRPRLPRRLLRRSCPPARDHSCVHAPATACWITAAAPWCWAGTATAAAPWCWSGAAWCCCGTAAVQSARHADESQEWLSDACTVPRRTPLRHPEDLP